MLLDLREEKEDQCICSEKKIIFFWRTWYCWSTSSIGTGIAFANKYKNKKSVTFTFFGDGAVNQGQVYDF